MRVMEYMDRDLLGEEIDHLLDKQVESLIRESGKQRIPGATRG